MAQHPIVHFEIYGDDRHSLGTFYADTFGWKVTDMPELGYGMIHIAEEGLRGGGLADAEPDFSGTIIYMSCPDIHDTVARAVERGAEVVGPIESIPGMATFAVLKDPQGNRFGLTAEDVPE